MTLSVLGIYGLLTVCVWVAISAEGIDSLLWCALCVAAWLLVHRSEMSVLVTVVAGFWTT